MRRIPYSPPRTPLALRIPVRQKARTRRPAPTLEPAIHSPKNGKAYNRGGEAEEYIGDSREYKSKGHEKPRIGPIRGNSANKFAKAVGNGHNASQNTHVAFFITQILH